MKFIFYFLFFVFLVFIDQPSYAQWAATYGGPHMDVASSIQQTSDGGYIVAGNTSSFGNEETDIWVLKLDPNGVIQWQKTYGGTHGDGVSSYQRSIQQTSDGGYIVAGYTSSFGNGETDVWVLKLDPNGNVQWQKTYGGSLGDWAASIQQTNDGGYIVAGTTHSFDFIYNLGNSSLWILKLDSVGNVQWQKTYGVIVSGGSIQQTSDGGYIVAGSAIGAGDWDFWILKLDPDGIIQWQKTYGGTNWDMGESIQQTSDGGYIVAGNTAFFVENTRDFLVLKLDVDGNIQWQKIYGEATTGEDPGRIQQTNDGGYIVVGWRGTDLWVLKLDTNGVIQWQKAYEGGSWQDAASIQQTNDSGFIVAGRTLGADFWVLKLNPDGIIGSSCNFIQDTIVSGIDSSVTIIDTNASIFNSNAIPQVSNATFQDTNIQANIYCKGENCNNGIDDDGNGFMDCADPDCACQPICTILVTIDIKPGSDPNSINLGSGGTVPVAILGTVDLDATTIDPTTITLASAPVKLKGKGTPMASFEDVNGDGLLDLVVHVITEALQLNETDTETVLEGKTFDGKFIKGRDTVRVIP